MLAAEQPSSRRVLFRVAAHILAVTQQSEIHQSADSSDISTQPSEIDFLCSSLRGFLSAAPERKLSLKLEDAVQPCGGLIKKKKKKISSR